MFSLESVDCFDVLFKVLVFDVVLVAPVISALKWSRIGV